VSSTEAPAAAAVSSRPTLEPPRVTKSATPARSSASGPVALEPDRAHHAPLPARHQEAGEMRHHPVPREAGLGQEGEDGLEIGGGRVSDLEE
jgi:hypothetical protein